MSGVSGLRPGRNRAALATRLRDGQVPQLFAQFLWGGGDQRVHLVGGLPLGDERGTARETQYADHLDVAVGRLRHDGGFAGQHLAGGRLGIDRVGLALVASQPSVGPFDLDHDDPAGGQPAAQPRPVAAGPFDSDLVDRAELRRPFEQLGVAGGGRFDLGRVQPAAELIERDRDVDVLGVSTPMVMNTSADGIVFMCTVSCSSSGRDGTARAGLRTALREDSRGQSPIRSRRPGLRCA